MKIRELLPQQVVTVDVDTRVQDIALKMRDHGVGIVPVLQGEKLVGVVTDRDIAVRAVAASPECGNLRAHHVMTRHPVTIHEESDTEDVAVLMRARRLHRLIVVRNNGTVCGVISLTDLSLLGADAFEVLRRLSEKPGIEQYPEEDVTIPQVLFP